MNADDLRAAMLSQLPHGPVLSDDEIRARRGRTLQNAIVRLVTEDLQLLSRLDEARDLAHALVCIVEVEPTPFELLAQDAYCFVNNRFLTPQSLHRPRSPCAGGALPARR